MITLNSYFEVTQAALKLEPGQNETFEYSGYYSSCTFANYDTRLRQERPDYDFTFDWKVWPARAERMSLVIINCRRRREAMAAAAAASSSVRSPESTRPQASPNAQL